MIIQNPSIPQRKGALAFLALISAFSPLSTVLYLPVLPQMVEALETTQAMVNMTLSLFFLFFSVGLLFWGPLSEKFGRKPIILSGLTIFSLVWGCSVVSCGSSAKTDRLSSTPHPDPVQRAGMIFYKEPLLLIKTPAKRVKTVRKENTYDR